MAGFFQFWGWCSVPAFPQYVTIWKGTRTKRKSQTLLIKSILYRSKKAQGDTSFPILLVIILFGAGFRFFQIGKQPLWLDEGYSVWLGQHSIPEIIRTMIDIDQHPPVFHILLHLWMQIGGTSEGWVRTMSAILGIFTLAAIYMLGKTLAGKEVGLLSALVLAFSPFHVQFAQEARAYTLLTFSSCGSMWMTARLLLDQRSQNQAIGAQLINYLRNWKRQRAPGDWGEISTDLSWFGYMVFTALAFYGHNTAIFLPFGINLFVLCLIFFRRFLPGAQGRLCAPSSKNWIFAHLGVLLLWSPWFGPFIIQVGGVYNTFWIQKPTLEIVQDTLKTFVMAWLPDRLEWQWVIWMGFGLLFLLAFWKLRRTSGRFFLLAVLFLAPFLSELLISFWRPIFYDRTLIWCTIPLYVLIAIGISQLHHRSYKLTAVIILITLSLLSLRNYYAYYEKERWDLAAGYIQERFQEGDIILFNAGWGEIPFDYYFHRYDQKVEEYGLPATLFEWGELEPRMMQTDVPRLKAITQGRERVWLVYAHSWWTDPESIIPKTLEQERKLAVSRMFNGMQVLLYVSK
jgi:mannosyltransferase